MCFKLYSQLSHSILLDITNAFTTFSSFDTQLQKNEAVDEKKKKKMPSYKFDGRDFNEKSFNRVYVLADISNLHLKRVVFSATVICYKNDEYAIGYKTAVS